MFSNLFLLCPIFVTGEVQFLSNAQFSLKSLAESKVREKHLTLWNNIGTFAEEDEAFDLLTLLTWLLPVLVVTSAFFDLVLALVYLKWLHQSYDEDAAPELWNCIV